MIINEKVLSREETLEYLYNKFQEKERLIVSRYNDGEYFIMKQQETKVIVKLFGEDCSKILKDLLFKSIEDKRQFICTNYLKPKNFSENDIWYKVQRYIIDNSNNNLYGCSHWTVYDFCNENKLLPQLFSGDTLIISGLHEYFKPAIENYNKKIYFYDTPIISVEKSYKKIKEDLLKICKNFENILIACGSLSKVLLVDLIDECEANLIDIGSMINALCGKENTWPMSWTGTVDLKIHKNNFLSKLKVLS